MSNTPTDLKVNFTLRGLLLNLIYILFTKILCKTENESDHVSESIQFNITYIYLELLQIKLKQTNNSLRLNWKIPIM